MGNLFINILEMTLPISAWIFVLLLFSPLLKRSYVAKWRYFMWLFVAARLVLPFRLTSGITMEIPSEIASRGAVSAAKSAIISPVQIMSVVWIAGMAVMIIYQIISYISFKRLINRWSYDICDDKMLLTFETAKEFEGIKRKIAFKRCKTVTTPMVFGITKPILLLPCIDFTDDELPIILRHELVHLKRCDIWYKLLLIAARTIHWFNPFAYLMVKAANRDMELACDAEVVKSENDSFRQNYCEAIMKLVHNGRGRGTALSTCLFMSKKTVMERFKTILDVKIKRSGIVMFCVVAVSIAVSGGAVTFATEQVADKVEDDLQIIERPIEPPKSTAAPVPTPHITDEPEPEREVYAYSTEAPKSEVYTKRQEPQVNDNQLQTSPPISSVTPAPIEEETAAPIEEEPIHIDGEEREMIQQQLGEPQVVSGDGSKEVYSLPDGNKAVAQYSDDLLDAGYIIIE